MVPVFAYGAGAENFTGIFQNSDIFKKICALLKLK
jgi:alkaline phosphatase